MPDSTQILSPADQLSAVIGFFLPPLIAVIQNLHWKTSFKTLIAFLVYVAVSIIKLSVEQRLDWSHFQLTFLLIMFTSVAAFQGGWKPSGIALAIEKATTTKKRKEGI